MIPTSRQLAGFVRKDIGLRRTIVPEDRIERDLGGVGEDAIALPERIERRRSAALAAAVFDSLKRDSQQRDSRQCDTRPHDTPQKDVRC